MSKKSLFVAIFGTVFMCSILFVGSAHAQQLTQEQLKLLIQALQQLLQPQQSLPQVPASPPATPQATQPYLVAPPFMTQTTTVSGSCRDFKVNLKFGDSDTDVSVLHDILQKEGFDIDVSDVKQGYFGESTASAVTGFQQKYQDEILTPLGLKYGTGYVGKATRTKLSKLYGCGVVPPSVCIQVITPAQNPETGECKNFSTPCDVPAGWTKVASCETPPSPPSTTTQPVVIPEGKLILAIDPAVPSSKSYQAGTSNVALAQFKITAPLNSQITVRDIYIVDYSTPPGGYYGPVASSDLKNFSLWDGATQIGQTVSAILPAATGTTPSAHFAGLTWVIPGGTSKLLTVKADISFTAGQNTHALRLDAFNYVEFVPSNWGEVNLTAPQFTITSGAGQIPQPSVDLKVNGSDGILDVSAGATLQITWSSANVVSCFAMNQWYGSKPTSGTEVATAPSVNVSTGILYSLECTSADGSKARDSVQINVYPGVVPSITLLSPNGGESFAVGSTMKVIWSTQNYSSSSLVNVYLFKSDIIPPTDLSYQWVANAAYQVPNSGTVSWTIPSSVTPGTNYFIKILCASLPSSFGLPSSCIDRSDAPFNIISSTSTIQPSQPSLTVLSPNGSETLTNGQPYTITWSSQNLSSDSLVTISLLHLTTNSRRNQFVNIANSGSIVWTINTPESFDNNYKILIEANCNSYGTNCAASDQSDVPFSIVSATSTSIIVTAPTTGMTVAQGGQLMIKWAGGTPTVNVSLVIPNASAIVFLAKDIANTGTYTWTVPNTYLGSGYRILIGTVGISPGYVGQSSAFDIVAATSTTTPAVPPTVPSSSTTTDGGAGYQLQSDQQKAEALLLLLRSFLGLSSGAW